MSPWLMQKVMKLLQRRFLFIFTPHLFFRHLKLSWMKVVFVQMKTVWPGGRASWTPSRCRWTSCQPVSQIRLGLINKTSCGPRGGSSRISFCSVCSPRWPRRSPSRPWRKPSVRGRGFSDRKWVVPRWSRRSDRSDRLFSDTTGLEEQERERRRQVMEKFQKAPFEELAAHCESKVGNRSMEGPMWGPRNSNWQPVFNSSGQPAAQPPGPDLWAHHPVSLTHDVLKPVFTIVIPPSWRPTLLFLQA